MCLPSVCLTCITARDHISQAFPILQAIQVWRWEWPRNKAMNYCFMLGTYKVQRSDKALVTSESWNKLRTQQWKYQTLHIWNDPSLHTWLKLAWTSPRLVRSISIFVCMHVGLYAMAGSAGHLHHTLLLPLHAPILLTHPISFIEQVCPTVRPCLSDTMLEWHQQRERERIAAVTLDEKSRYIVPPMCCYFTHVCPTMFYIQLESQQRRFVLGTHIQCIVTGHVNEVGMVTVTRAYGKYCKNLLDFDWKLVNLFRHNYYVKEGALYKRGLDSHWYQRVHAY